MTSDSPKERLTGNARNPEDNVDDSDQRSFEECIKELRMTARTARSAELRGTSHTIGIALDRLEELWAEANVPKPNRK